jgi:hypothetical protein
MFYFIRRSFWTGKGRRIKKGNGTPRRYVLAVSERKIARGPVNKNMQPVVAWGGLAPVLPLPHSSHQTLNGPKVNGPPNVAARKLTEKNMDPGKNETCPNKLVASRASSLINLQI